MESGVLVHDMWSPDEMENVANCSSSIPLVLQVAFEMDPLCYDKDEQVVYEYWYMAVHIQVWGSCQEEEDMRLESAVEEMAHHMNRNELRVLTQAMSDPVCRPLDS